ncbi:MAG: NAD(P)/FAD-dependent oxidoreductase [Candidatus Eisenbacteria bacterium]|nr:NAD(P)/FAD-dependent oxidoreductase [Candidatus Eisenbacteria bacterium]
MPSSVIVVGAGVAGFTAARAVRGLDSDVPIEIYTREPYHYYYRPRLPDLVGGEVEPEDIIAFPDDWYRERRIDVRLEEPVASVLPDDRKIVLEGGRKVGYGSLLIATGADPFVPPIEGSTLDGVFVLRTMRDALSIRERASVSGRAVVIGGGLLGLESGRGLQRQGLSVTVLETADWLLPRQLDRQAASILLGDVRDLGMSVRTGVQVEKIGGDGSVSCVSLADGTDLPCDMVLVSTGVRSTVGFLEGSGLEVDRGVVVDAGMRSSASGVFAAGDVAQFAGMRGGNIPVAISQAEAAAVGLAGDARGGEAGAVSYNTLKIVGIDVFSAGEIACSGDECREHVYSDEQNSIYRKVIVRAGTIVGAMVVGSRRGVTALNSLVQEAADVEAWGEAIAREDFDFGKTQ